MNKEGLGKEGLGTLIRAAFLRPVHIMRQSISNLGMVHSPIDAYHQSKGLSSLRSRPGYIEDTLITIGITNLINRLWGYAHMRFGNIGFDK
jgi:hypothetical protein